MNVGASGASGRVRFGSFEFDRRNRLLYRDGLELALPPRAVGVLACLLDRGGEVVSKQDLLDEVWKDANVTETSLAEAVSLLRQTLADDSQRPTFIQTIPRRGYRFVHPLTTPETPMAPGALGAATPAAAALATPAANLAHAEEGSRLAPGEGAHLAHGANGATSANGTNSTGRAIAAGPALARPSPLSFPPGTGIPDEGSSAKDWAAEVSYAGVVAAPLPRSEARNVDDETKADERVWPGWLPWVLLGAMSIALAMVLATSAREPSRTVRPVTRFTLALPAELTLASNAPAIALSNDGRRLAFVASREGEPPRVFIRDLDQLEPAMLADTEGAAAPFFSPDGQWVGFFANGQLRKMPVGGGRARTICLAPHPFGATWTPDGSIIFASSWTGGLQQVSEEGGDPIVLTVPDASIGEMRHAWPDLLPDGRSVLFAGLSGSDAPETARVAVLSLDRRGTVQPLFEAATYPRFVSTGHLLFTRGDAVFAAPFDPVGLAVLGQASPVLDGIRPGGPHGATQLAITRAGNLVTAASDVEDAPDELRWLDTDSRTGPVGRRDSSAAALPPSQNGAAGWPFPARLLRALAVNGDGSRVAASLGDGHRTDIWVSDLPDGVAARLTSAGQNVLPQWTPDGRVIFSARRDEAFNLFAKRPDDAAAAMRLTHSPANQFVSSASSALGAVFVESRAQTGLDLWLLPWNGGAPRPLARTARDETAGALSPDGRWLAYQIGDRGTWRVVLRATDRESQTPMPVAEGDGTLTAWSADGRALFFIRNGRLLRLPLTVGAAASPVSATARTNAATNTGTGMNVEVGDAASDGGFAPWRAAGDPVELSGALRDAEGYAVSAAGRALAAAPRAVTRAAARPHLEVVLEWARELSLKVPVQAPAMKAVR